MATDDAVTIRSDRRPGDDALIVRLHIEGYVEEGPRFRGDDFGPYVARTVAEAGLDAPSASRVWFAERAGRAIGCAAMIDRGACGQLRWVVLVPEARGLGLGKELVTRALDYAAAQGWREVYLETTDGLDASMALYERLGFAVCTDMPTALWHGRGHHITMHKALATDPAA